MEHNVNVGFDIDGTLTNERFETFHAQATTNRQSVDLYVDKMLDFTPSKWMQVLQNLLLNSSARIFIVTFRWQEWAEITYRWFEKQGIEREQMKWFFSTPEIRTVVPEEYRRVATAYKTRILQENSIDIYYEDSDFLVEELRKTCPKTTVVHVGRRI